MLKIIKLVMMDRYKEKCQFFDKAACFESTHETTTLVPKTYRNI